MRVMLGVFTLLSVPAVLQAKILGFQCPESTGLFPDPLDCSVFFQCSDWTPYRFQCQDGLLFNAEQGYCDWPSNVDCDTTSSTTEETDKPTSTHIIKTTSISTASKTTATVKPTITVPIFTTKPDTTPRTTPFTTIAKTTTSTTTAGRTTTTTAKITTSTTADRTTTTTPLKTTTEPLTTELSPSTTTTENVVYDCNIDSNEPITEEIKALRLETCLAPNKVVENVSPGSPNNPDNVKILEKIFPKQNFKSEFPRANSAYTYENLLKAFAKFPAVCKTEELCRKALATMFAHFQQETAGLYYINEINQDVYCADWSDWVVSAYPCTPDQKYFGRGAKQLTWNYNYGALSRAMYGDEKVLLENPSLVADTWLNFASAIWFFVTPQPPKPSMHAIVDGSWTPNTHDINENRLPGFGTTIMVINGAYECGENPINPTGSSNRQTYYRKFAADFHVKIAGEKLDCKDMESFDGEGSANPSIYWAPEIGCKMANWQTAYSALVEGDYQKCLQHAKSSLTEHVP